VPPITLWQYARFPAGAGNAEALSTHFKPVSRLSSIPAAGKLSVHLSSAAGDRRGRVSTPGYSTLCTTFITNAPSISLRILPMTKILATIRSTLALLNSAQCAPDLSRVCQVLRITICSIRP